MQFTQEMMLHSDSGYCMPFEDLGLWKAEASKDK